MGKGNYGYNNAVGEYARKQAIKDQKQTTVDVAENSVTTAVNQVDAALLLLTIATLNNQMQQEAKSNTPGKSKNSASKLREIQKSQKTLKEQDDDLSKTSQEISLGNRKLLSDGSNSSQAEIVATNATQIEASSTSATQEDRYEDRIIDLGGMKAKAILPVEGSIEYPDVILGTNKYAASEFTFVVDGGIANYKTLAAIGIKDDKLMLQSINPETYAIKQEINLIDPERLKMWGLDDDDMKEVKINPDSIKKVCVATVSKPEVAINRDSTKKLNDTDLTQQDIDSKAGNLVAIFSGTVTSDKYLGGAFQNNTDYIFLSSIAQIEYMNTNAALGYLTTDVQGFYATETRLSLSSEIGDQVSESFYISQFPDEVGSLSFYAHIEHKNQTIEEDVSYKIFNGFSYASQVFNGHDIGIKHYDIFSHTTFKNQQEALLQDPKYFEGITTEPQDVARFSDGSRFEISKNNSQLVTRVLKKDTPAISTTPAPQSKMILSMMGSKKKRILTIVRMIKIYQLI